MATAFGFYGFFFVDYGKNYVYQTTKIIPAQKSGEDATTTEETQTLHFSSIHDVLQYNTWNKINPRYLPSEYFAWLALLHGINRQEINFSQTIPETTRIEQLINICKEYSNNNNNTTSISSSSTTTSNKPNNQSKYVSEIACKNIIHMYHILISPVVAILGGLIGTEIIKLISRKDEPVNNTFVFDAMGNTGGVVVYLNGKE